MSKKTFNYAVIYNGVFYPANTPIEIKDKVAQEIKAEKPEIEIEAKPEKKAVKANDRRTTKSVKSK